MLVSYNVLIEEFCESHHLGEVKEARLLPAGITNQTYFVETTTGKYVVKALNPYRYKTKEDIQKLETTEYISELANQNGVSTIAAKRINGKLINILHEQHYIVFDFFEGDIIPLNRISVENCFDVGRMLAELHNLSFKEQKKLNSKNKIQMHNYAEQFKGKVDWDHYYKKAAKNSPKWLSRLKNEIVNLYEVFDLSFAAYLSFIPQDVVIAHGDLFNHNILWKDNVPYIIDWEAAGFIDATYDCVYTAIRWSTKNYTEDKEDAVDRYRLYAFLNGYLEKRSINIENIEISLYMILYKRLTYFRNALIKYLNPRNESSKNRAESQIIYTLSIFRDYKNLINELERIKSYIVERQPEKEYEKSPSYGIMPKMKLLIESYNDSLDELKKSTKDHRRLTRKHKKLTEDYMHERLIDKPLKEVN